MRLDAFPSLRLRAFGRFGTVGLEIAGFCRKGLSKAEAELGQDRFSVKEIASRRAPRRTQYGQLEAAPLQVPA